MSRARLTRLRYLALFAAACALATGLANPPAASKEGAGRVAVLFGAKGPYRAAAEVLANELKSAGRECVLIELPESSDETARRQAVEQLEKAQPTLVAAGGVTATAEALRALPKVPVIFFMVPNGLDAPFMAASYADRKRVAGITSDIAPSEQVDWVLRTAPQTKKVAVLSSPRTEQTAKALEKAGKERGIVVTVIPAAQDKFPAAVDSLNESNCDGVLMIPDAQVYNSPNVERLLLWGVRGKKRVWAFSENVVAAGAFAGVYSDPAAVGKQAAGQVLEVLKGAEVAKIGMQYPKGFGSAVRASVNTHTAEMIGASLDESVFADGVSRVGGR